MNVNISMAKQTIHLNVFRLSPVRIAWSPVFLSFCNSPFCHNNRHTKPTFLDRCTQKCIQRNVSTVSVGRRGVCFHPLWRVQRPQPVPLLHFISFSLSRHVAQTSLGSCTVDIPRMILALWTERLGGLCKVDARWHRWVTISKIHPLVGCIMKIATA